MSFWNTSTGENAAQTTSNEFDMGGGDFEVIPDGTTALAIIESAHWAQDQSFNQYIELTWSCRKPDLVENRKVFQKLWVKDPDPRAKDANAKRDKALRMLAAIDANAGGKLAGISDIPTDDQLAIALQNKPMAISIRVWEMKNDSGDMMEGNWVAAVHPKSHELKMGKAKQKPQVAGNASDDLDDDIPF